MKYFREAAAKKSDIFEIYYGLGKLLVYHTDEYRESIHNLSVALGIRKHTDVYLLRALAYLKIGQAKEADVDIEKSIAINPHYYHPYYVLACIYAKQNRLDEAMKMIEKILLLDVTRKDLLLNAPDLWNLKDKMEKIF